MPKSLVRDFLVKQGVGGREAYTADFTGEEMVSNIIRYAYDDEEHAVGLRCVAAPIFDENGQVLAAISLSGPKARMTDARLAELGAAMQQTAEEITQALGGDKPE